MFCGFLCQKKKYKFYPIRKSLTSWRSLDDSLSSPLFQKLFDGYFVYRKFLKQSFFRSLLSLFILSVNYLKNDRDFYIYYSNNNYQLYFQKKSCY